MDAEKPLWHPCSNVLCPHHITSSSSSPTILHLPRCIAACPLPSVQGLHRGRDEPSALIGLLKIFSKKPRNFRLQANFRHCTSLIRNLSFWKPVSNKRARPRTIPFNLSTIFTLSVALWPTFCVYTPTDVLFMSQLRLRRAPGSPDPGRVREQAWSTCTCRLPGRGSNAYAGVLRPRRAWLRAGATQAAA